MVVYLEFEIKFIPLLITFLLNKPFFTKKASFDDLFSWWVTNDELLLCQFPYRSCNTFTSKFSEEDSMIQGYHKENR